MERYQTFYELFSSVSENKTLFSYLEDGKEISVSYPDFSRQVSSYPEIRGKTFAYLGDGTYKALLLLFVLAYQKKTIILLNPLEDEKSVKQKLSFMQVDGYVIGHDLKVLPDAEKRESPKETFFYFYTSGTTSSQKAVVLTEESLCSSCYNGSYCLPLKDEDRFLSLLPLFHVFGFVCALLWPRQCHCTICLGRGRRSLGEDFALYHPTAVSLVPQLAKRLLRFKLINKERKLVLIGAGDCPDDIIDGYKSLGIRVSFGYGRTETSSGLALSLGEKPRERTPCPDVNIQIAPDQEILVKAPSLLRKGYFLDGKRIPPKLDRGYFHTGDLGKIDDNGHLRIIGRKKEILVLPTGTKIFLPEYEAKLGKFLDEKDFAIGLSKDNEITLFIHPEKEKEEIEDKVSLFNRNYPRGEQIAKTIIKEKPLPRTSTGKIRRYRLTEGNE